MAVLIEGMEMPKGCASCPFFDDECFGAYKCDAVQSWGSDTERASGCPLIPIPPHGRLIDKDALDIYQRAEAAYAEYQEDEDNLYLEGMANGLCEAAKQLSTARTVIHASKEG